MPRKEQDEEIDLVGLLDVPKEHLARLLILVVAGFLGTIIWAILTVVDSTQPWLVRTFLKIEIWITLVNNYFSAYVILLCVVEAGMILYGILRKTMNHGEKKGRKEGQVEGQIEGWNGAHEEVYKALEEIGHSNTISLLRSTLAGFTGWQIVAVPKGYLDEHEQDRDKQKAGYRRAETFSENQKKVAEARKDELQKQFDTLTSNKNVSWKVSVLSVRRQRN